VAPKTTKSKSKF